jgi:hypothetical protein
MAKKQATKKRVARTNRFVFLKTLCCVTILAACFILFIGGVREGVRTSKIIYHCVAASFGIGSIFGVALWAMTNYEEINGGQA